MIAKLFKKRETVYPITSSSLSDFQKKKILRDLDYRAEGIEFHCSKAGISLTEINNETLYLQLVRLLIKKIERNEVLTGVEISILNGMFSVLKDIAIEIVPISELSNEGRVLPGSDFFFVNYFGYVRLREVSGNILNKFIHTGTGENSDG
ncbi:hypothetical protein [Paenibacillus campinasensis]|uniref:Uncharacterized protein n=1 Tax=Paenibacillus campinasensis TaxID=66347 RepID=A0A268EIY3_9BACL|nr:hypothetical protein [Paenibacillus campinasensis]PAD73073.1 hypothetical protein CHH67_21070 [Paenibacillus campinasensis]